MYRLSIPNHTILLWDHISKKCSNLRNVSTQKSTQSENHIQKYDVDYCVVNEFVAAFAAYVAAYVARYPLSGLLAEHICRSCNSPFNLSEYIHECNEKILLKKLRWYQLENFIILTGIKEQNNRKVFTRISNIFNRNH